MLCNILNELIMNLQAQTEVINQQRDKEHTHCCGFTLDPKQNQSGCGHKWTHKMSDFEDQEEYDKGHVCPKCGKGPWSWHVCDATLKEHQRRQREQTR
jgi:hypothetical protein